MERRGLCHFLVYIYEKNAPFSIRECVMSCGIDKFFWSKTAPVRVMPWPPLYPAGFPPVINRLLTLPNTYVYDIYIRISGGVYRRPTNIRPLLYLARASSCFCCVLCVPLRRSRSGLLHIRREREKRREKRKNSILTLLHHMSRPFIMCSIYINSWSACACKSDKSTQKKKKKRRRTRVLCLYRLCWKRGGRNRWIRIPFSIGSLVQSWILDVTWEMGSNWVCCIALFEWQKKYDDVELLGLIFFFFFSLFLSRMF